jgi:transcription antitermination factor NusG
MPILTREVDLYPADLLERSSDEEQCWWAFYTLSRREKQLTRYLLAREIPFYSPLIPRRYRSPNGRVRTSFRPLFANYVFVSGSDVQRSQTLASNCISRWFPVQDGVQLKKDLRQIWRLIELGQPLAPESRLDQGDRVRVLSGHFQGFEGFILRREQETRLLVAVHFMQQGASVLLNDCQLERI